MCCESRLCCEHRIFERRGGRPVHKDEVRQLHVLDAELLAAGLLELQQLTVQGITAVRNLPATPRKVQATLDTLDCCRSPPGPGHVWP